MRNHSAPRLHDFFPYAFLRLTQTLTQQFTAINLSISSLKADPAFGLYGDSVRRRSQNAVARVAAAAAIVRRGMHWRINCETSTSHKLFMRCVRQIALCKNYESCCVKITRFLSYRRGTRRRKYAYAESASSMTTRFHGNKIWRSNVRVTTLKALANLVPHLPRLLLAAFARQQQFGSCTVAQYRQAEDSVRPQYKCTWRYPYEMSIVWDSSNNRLSDARIGRKAVCGSRDDRNVVCGRP